MQKQEGQINLKQLANAARSIAPTFVQFSQQLYKLVESANKNQKRQIELLKVALKTKNK